MTLCILVPCYALLHDSFASAGDYSFFEAMFGQTSNNAAKKVRVTVCVLHVAVSNAVARCLLFAAYHLLEARSTHVPACYCLR
jgi:hypothetical protein